MGKKKQQLFFGALTEQQVAFLAYSDIYDRFIKDGESTAGMALLSMLMKDGVLTNTSMKAGLSGDDFDLTKAKFYLRKIPFSRWAKALAEFAVSRSGGDDNNRVTDVIAATMNAFNAIESPGLGAVTGQQIHPWLFALGMPWRDRRVDYRSDTDVKEGGKTFGEATESFFKTGFDRGLFTKKNGYLSLNYQNNRFYSDLVARAIHFASGSKDENYDYKELVRALDILNAGETHAKSEQRRDHLRAVVRYYENVEYISKAILVNMIKSGLLRTVQGPTWISNSWKTATFLDLDFNWAYIAKQSDWGTRITDIPLMSGDVAKRAWQKPKFRDVELGEWMVNLGLLPTWSHGDDAKDIAKFIIRSVNPKADLGSVDYSVLNSLVWDGVISPRGQNNVLTLKVDALSGERLAQGFKSFSGSKDNVFSVMDALRVLKFVMPGQPVWQDGGGTWYYNRDRSQSSVWFRKTDNPVADLNGWLGQSLGGTLTFLNKKKGEWRFNNLADLGKALKDPAFRPMFDTRYRSGTLESLAPVVLDLDANGLDFTPLASSVAHYDVDNSGVRRNLAWTKDALLAFDADSDGRITKTNELSFVSYKEGAKTDLEGLTAFDSNGDGKLSVLDKLWKKFVVWLDRNGDGVSDEGELVTLDKLGIASIDLTSDKKRQNLDGVTLHGTTTFTTTDGRKGTVGDVSFDTSKEALSPAEIARRRDLLVQAIATGTPSSSAGIFAANVNAKNSPNLFMPGGGR